ncbi:MAG: hypothetical protein LBE12_01225 [Planctomycetaceae bacterium]|nr:hypothetical protein [Planctomycetaceae bacterium]
MKKSLLEQWTNAVKTDGVHFIGLLKSFKVEEINIPKENFLHVKDRSWQIIKHSNNLLLLYSFCSTLLSIGNHDDVNKLGLLQKRFDLNTPSGYRACEIVNDTRITLAYRLAPKHGMPSKTGISPITLKEFELLGPIVSLDEKTAKEREEAKAKRIRMIQEEPEKAANLAKQLVGDTQGRLEMIKKIGNIQESEVMRKAMKDTLSFYYSDKRNEQGENFDEKASLDEVKKIKELLKSENQKLKSDILDIIRSARCVSLIPNLFEMCYSTEVPPYLGFGSVDPKTKKIIRFQYSPTQIISYLGNEQVIPELEKLINSVTVSETMKQDARLTIDIIKRKQREEKERIASREKEKGLIAEGKLFVAEAGGPMDTKMNPFYDPNAKLNISPDAPKRLNNSRTWTSLEGWHSLNAVIVRKENDHIVLVRDADEKEITVPIKRLSIQDQEYIKNWIPQKNK